MMRDIDPVNLSAVDLNLLVVLDAVLSTRSATLAASRLHLTQPAVSNALKRARALFDDPIVLRCGSGFTPTPFGEALAPRLGRALEQVAQLLTSQHEPAAPRTVSIGCLDGVSIVLLPTLVPILREQLPNTRLRAVPPDLGRDLGLEHAEVDLVIGAVRDLPHGCEAEDLLEDPMVVIAAADHPRIKTRLSVDAYASLPHVELSVFGRAEDRVDRALATVNRSRDAEVTVPHLAALPFLVARSHRIATVAHSLALRFAEPLNLRVHKPPVPVPPLTLKMVWHRRRSLDPIHLQLRALVHTATQQIARVPSRSPAHR